MSTGFKVSVTGQDALKQNVSYLRANFPRWLDAANLETANEIASLARSNVKGLDAFDTGELYGSIVVSVSPKGLSVTVAAKAKQAPFVEFGTSPHFPPLEPIRQWCIHKGIDPKAAYPIAKKIAERGTPERAFLYPAYLVGMRNHVDRVRKYVIQGLRSLLA